MMRRRASPPRRPSEPDWSCSRLGKNNQNFIYLRPWTTGYNHFFLSSPQVLSFTHPVSFHSAETFESLLGCLKMDDEKVAEAALQIFKNTGSKMEESFPHIKSYVSAPPLLRVVLSSPGELLGAGCDRVVLLCSH